MEILIPKLANELISIEKVTILLLNLIIDHECIEILVIFSYS